MKKEEKVNSKIQDTTIPIGDKYCLNLFDTTEVKVSKSAIISGRELYFSKINALEKTNDNVLNLNKNVIDANTDYVAFEILSSLKKQLLENPELQRYFMSYVALYFLNTKRENRDERYHYIGFLTKAEERHFAQSFTEKEIEYFENNLERIIKAHCEIEK